jgi:hypothetical protein
MTLKIQVLVWDRHKNVTGLDICSYTNKINQISFWTLFDSNLNIQQIEK